MISLEPSLQQYAWGDSTSLAQLLGFAPDGSPVAEAWWGAHPSAPALTDEGGLDTVISRDVAACLGNDSPAGATLPYLLKVLAIEKPLSIQVHPTMERAIEGFAAEQAAGVPLDSPARTFKDRSHKPELIVALTPMSILAGFRPAQDVADDLAMLSAPGALRLREALEGGGFATYVREVFSGNVTDAIVEAGDGAKATSASARLAASAGSHFPGDPGILVALAMNAVTLEPGQALFTGAGVIHSYQSGVGVEVMANSDNVVRAGLTPKHVDVALILDIAELYHVAPTIVEPVTLGAARAYVTPATEFALTWVAGGESVARSGPRIVLALEGEVRVATSAQSIVLLKGQSAFVKASEGPATVSAQGSASAVVAGVPVATGGAA